jgi:predicted CDP-diglyceride synthetase/phosphatidate cytidylyltransferase
LNKVRPIIPYAFASVISYDIIRSKVVRSKGIKGIIGGIIGGLISGMLIGYLLDYFTPVDVRLPRLCCGEIVSELHEEYQASTSFSEEVELVSYA